MEAPTPAAKYALSSFYTSRFPPSSSASASASGSLNGTADENRKRKITDKNLPGGLAQEPEFAAESAMYRDLLQMERKLDWTMTRKRVEVHDALQRIVPVSGPLFSSWRGFGVRASARGGGEEAWPWSAGG